MRDKTLHNATILAIALMAASVALLCPTRSPAQDDEVRSPDEILAECGETPSAEAIRELFINCSEWDEEHEDVKESSRQALIDLGAVVVPTLLDGWLSSVDLRRRIELDTIIAAIGQPGAEYLLPYIESIDEYTRRHSAYLIGDTAAAKALEDPLAVGPLDEDLLAIDALEEALAKETDWHAMSSMIGALGKMRDPAQVELIASYLTSEEQAIRLAAVTGLSQIPHHDAVLPLMRAFADSVTTVRQAAVLTFSTETMGNLAYEALLGAAVLPSAGATSRLCTLQALAGYLDTIAADDSSRSIEQRQRAFNAAIQIIEHTPADMWQVRGFAVNLLSFTYHTDAAPSLEQLAETEKHPFVAGKIREALDRLEEGRPEPEEEAT